MSFCLKYMTGLLNNLLSGKRSKTDNSGFQSFNKMRLEIFISTLLWRQGHFSQDLLVTYLVLYSIYFLIVLSFVDNKYTSTQDVKK